MRGGDLRPAHLLYDLKSSDLFPAIRETLAVAKDARAKLEIGFELPPDDAPPEDRSVLAVDLLGPKSIR